MKGNIEAYKSWAPPGAKWVEWAKPAMFVNMPAADAVAGAGGGRQATGFPDDHPASDTAGGVYGKPDIPSISWIQRAEWATAAIVDLPGAEGVLEGVALARAGFRPVPLYNGVYGQTAVSTTVHVAGISGALATYADEVAGLGIRPDAPPAFLLDSNRMGEVIINIGNNPTGAYSGFLQKKAAAPGVFDNRWCVFPQDMPSAEYLLQNGINSIVVRTKKIADDLAHILFRYEKKGLAIYTTDGGARARANISAPPQYKAFARRFLVTLGFRRNAAGGFGEAVPEPSSSHGRRHFYG